MGGGKQNGCEEVSGGFVAAHRDTTKMLQLVEEALDQVALPIDEVVDRTLDFAVSGSRDVRPATASLDKVDDGPGVIATVGDEVAIRLEPFDQDRRNGLVRRLTLREHDPDWHTLLIDYRVDLGA